MPVQKSWELSKVLEIYAQQTSNDGVYVYDFGGSQTLMPVPDLASGSYLTKSICFLHTKGDEPPLQQGERFPTKDGEILDCGNGWKFIAVEMFPWTTPEQLIASLEEKKLKLLGLT